jgi:glycosyltransferase involved in cell wall biosynthesis
MDGRSDNGGDCGDWRRLETRSLTQPPRFLDQQFRGMYPHPMTLPQRLDASEAAPPGDMGGVPDIQLILPKHDVQSPEVSIVVPTLNEETTISEFVSWCHEGLQRLGATGEILIVDSSSDRTPDLAVEGGARVLRTPKRGLGRAYIDALPFIRGKYVVMGDADCTYDFRELGLFIEKLREGYEFAMGSRWLGTIEDGAMPALHRYFGTPITTLILNRIYGSRFSDIHCGMRAMTYDALMRIGLSSQSWEYASEMVLKAAVLELRTAEVPVSFYKDREGRLSHHKRAGWLSPFKAAWINLRAMFIYRAEFFMFKPGLTIMIVGLLLTLPLSFGPIVIGPVTLSLYWMLFGLTLSILGLQSFFFGALAQIFCDHSGRARQRWTQVFRYTRAVTVSALIFLLGLVPAGNVVIYYLTHHRRLPSPASVTDHLGVTGVLLMIIGFSAFCFTLLLHSTAVRYGTQSSSHESDDEPLRPFALAQGATSSVGQRGPAPGT